MDVNDNKEKKQLIIDANINFLEIVENILILIKNQQKTDDEKKIIIIKKIKDLELNSAEELNENLFGKEKKTLILLLKVYLNICNMKNIKYNGVGSKIINNLFFSDKNNILNIFKDTYICNKIIFLLTKNFILNPFFYKKELEEVYEPSEFFLSILQNYEEKNHFMMMYFYYYLLNTNKNKISYIQQKIIIDRLSYLYFQEKLNNIVNKKKDNSNLINHNFHWFRRFLNNNEVDLKLKKDEYDFLNKIRFANQKKLQTSLNEYEKQIKQQISRKKDEEKYNYRENKKIS
jgi:hypothetical protein